MYNYGPGYQPMYTPNMGQPQDAYSARLAQMEHQQQQQLQQTQFQQQQHQNTLGGNVMQQPQQPAPAQIPFVGGVEGAKAYPLAPGSSAILMDNAEAMFYTVQVDAQGMRSIEPYVFQKTELKVPQQVNLENYATKEDLQAILEQIADLKGAVVGNG